MEQVSILYAIPLLPNQNLQRFGPVFPFIHSTFVGHLLWLYASQVCRHIRCRHETSNKITKNATRSYSRSSGGEHILYNIPQVFWLGKPQGHTGVGPHRGAGCAGLWYSQQPSGTGYQTCIHSPGFQHLKTNVKDYIWKYLQGKNFCNLSYEINLSSVIQESSQCLSKCCLLPGLSIHTETGRRPLDRKLKDLGTLAVILISSPSERLWLRKKKEEMKWEQLTAVSLKNQPEGHLIRGENAQLGPEDTGSGCDSIQTCRGAQKAQEKMRGKWVKAICTISKVYTPLHMQNMANKTNFLKKKNTRGQWYLSHTWKACRVVLTWTW